MPMGCKRISAVIVTFNNVEMLVHLVNDLLSQTRPPDRIVVVDNASVDDTAEVMRTRFPGVRYIRLDENTGSAGGYYEAIKAVLPDSDLIWTLDDDVRLRDDSLEELLKGMEKLDPKLSLSSVRSVGPSHPHSSPTRLVLFPWRGTLIKSDLIRRFGLPIKDFFIYGEDIEYASRFNSKGFYCYWIPTSVCVEERKEGKNDYVFAGGATKIYSRPFQLYYAFRNNLYVFVLYRDVGRLLRLILYAVKVTLLLLLFDRKTAYEKIRAVYEGLFHGVQKKLGRNRKYLP
jgi:rhamnopyranosyl-N-acetylglucosaminyl-diphospho-decaprenol beta-1,3/1,4-galactofuranosyltransferase